MSFEANLNPCAAIEQITRIIRDREPRKVHENMKTLQSICGCYEIKAWRTRRALRHCCDIDVTIRKSNNGSLIEVHQRGNCKASHAQEIENVLRSYLK